MAMFVLFLILTLPAGLYGLEWDSTWRQFPERHVFGTEDEEIDEERGTGVDFGDFALGNVLATYPYHAYHYDEAAFSGSDGFVVPGLLEVHAAPMYSPRRELGFTADAYATFILFGAGASVRYWGRDNAGENVQSLSYGWFGVSTFPLRFMNASVGGAYAQLALPDGERLTGFMFTSRVTGYPLWPLSFSMDVAIGRMSGVVLDTGATIGVMAYRHVFVEAGYRYTASFRKDFEAHGFTLGIQFTWSWLNTLFSPFDPPRRGNTW